jgi:AraC-like DNA-binding protein
MDMIWSQNKMMKLLKSFYTLVNVRIGFFDLEGGEIQGYPVYRTEYCNIIRAQKAGDNACRRCDKQAFRQAAKMKGPYVYQCHAGLIEMVAPIITSEDERIGYLMIGKARQPEDLDDNLWKDIGRKAGLSNMARLKSAYLQLPVLKMDQGRACADVLQALATYVWFDNYFRVQKEPLSVRIKDYISMNLSKPLSLKEIADGFEIGKTTLCKSVKREMHITVNELIRSLRIDKAKQLLQTGEFPIFIVAEQVGIPDYNYFTKVFKEETGVTPSIFRRLCENEYLNQHPIAPINKSLSNSA